MHRKHSIKTSIVVGFIFLTLIGVLFTSIVGSVEIDEGDGVWSDDFKTAGSVDCNNCMVDNDDGIIMLNKSTDERQYNFSEENFPHTAYAYKSLFFLPITKLFSPESHTQFESEFNDRDYDRLADSDDNYAERSSGGFRRYIVHHFKFQLDVDGDSVGDLKVNWEGKVDNAKQLDIYYWRYLGEETEIKLWNKLINVTIEDNIKVNNTMTQDDAKLAIMEDNYIDICVVAYSNSITQSCTLYTDYFNIISTAEDTYDLGPGIATTNSTIEPESKDFYWDILTWGDYEPEGTSITYHLLSEDKNGNFSLIPDEYFDGVSNKDGFTSSPVYLYDIPTKPTDDDYDVTKIKIMANLTSTTPSKTPKVYSWALTWQADATRWQDLFNFTYRIDVKNKVNIADNSISISPIQGEWAMFGYNSENTRATDGKGPQGSSPSLNWYSSDEQQVGGGFRNPVIGDEYIYIFNFTDGLCKFDIQGDSPNSPTITKGFFPGNYMNSPAITEEFIIIASGRTGEGGRDNRIRGVSKDLDSSWKFDYNEKICYYSSPVVYENKLFISSWSGDTSLFPESENNKVIALNLLDDPTELFWEYDLPAGSYSTPAVYNDMVFVGCSKSTGDSFFVLDAQGNGDSSTNLIWSESVGAIGRASPVIYNNTVFVTSKSLGAIKITALSINNDSNDRVLWTKTICTSVGGAEADSTPAVNDGVLYVASPRGKIYALSVEDGEELWSTRVYTKILGDFLCSSPAYADGFVYIGTPAGEIYGLDTSNNGSKEWVRTTFETAEFGHASVLSSPIVSNGLVFIADEEGVLYSIGSYKASDEEIEGSLTSIPITLPKEYWWGKFHADYNTSTGGNIEFSILDKSKNHINDIEDGDAINLGDRPDLRTIRLQADLTAPNLSANPRFDSWYITFERDENAPDFVESSFEPSGDWLNNPTPVCKIDVWDNGTGLDLSSASFTIIYDNNTELDIEENGSPEYTGVNRTNFTKLTVDISSLDISENITNLTKITFSITDYADNTATFPKEFSQDTTKPISSVSDEINASEFNSESVMINATAEDAASGIASVSLYYRHSYTSIFSGDWDKFGDSTETSPSWDFTIGEDEGGYYELCTIATDKAGNVEPFPEEGDVWFIFDNEPPRIPDDLSEEHWFTSQPVISIEFSDDFLLDTIKYRPEFETEWTLIDSDINRATYDSEWDLDPDYWDQMADGEEYFLYFWINDSLGNTLTIDEDGFKIIKDEAKPNVDLEIPALETEWSFEDTFKITAFATDGDGSGIKTVELFYRYSEDGDFDDVNWSSYGDGGLTSEPFEWEFTAKEGNGYYEFYVRAEDVAGNAAESEVFSTGINIFPIFSVIAMVILIIALILITIVIIIKWRKK